MGLARLRSSLSALPLAADRPDAEGMRGSLSQPAAAAPVAPTVADEPSASPLVGSGSPERPLRAASDVARCAARTAWLILRHRVRQPADHRGLLISFADGTSASVYRETTIDREPATAPVFLAVSFKLRLVRRDWAHALFRAESLLNTVLFAGFPGLVSKLWLRHDQKGVYRGLYEWDDADLALSYVHALWWVLALVSEPSSIRYAVIPGWGRDEFLPAPPGPAKANIAADGVWWLPVAVD